MYKHHLYKYTVATHSVSVRKGAIKLKTLKLALEYRCFPIWVYDEQDTLMANDSPEEIKTNKEMDDKLILLQEKYNNLFIDDGVHFQYIGFKNTSDKQSLENSIREIYVEIKSLIKDTYQIENLITLQA